MSEVAGRIGTRTSTSRGEIMLALAPLRWATVLCVAALLAIPNARAAEFELPHVRATYDGIDEEHARAIARVVEAARAIDADRYGFEMPETIYVEVSAKAEDRKSTRLNSSHQIISYAVFCLKKKKTK